MLEASGLVVGYGKTVVLRDAAVRVRAGEWLGVLGANGSGKSTLLRAMTGQIPLMAGEVRIGGVDLRAEPEQAKRGFGYAVDPALLPFGLTGRQYLAMVASIRGCETDAWPRPDLVDMLALGPWLDHAIGACSLGTRGKISVAAALLGTPALLVLDEALNGLDPLVSIRVRGLLAGMVASGRHAVILSSHMLEQVAADATQVMLLAEGAVAHVWHQDALNAARRSRGGMQGAFLEAMRGLGAKVNA
jgi:ABC-2 type transport system ATP-binding protein